MAVPLQIRPNQTYHEIALSKDWEALRSERYREYRRKWAALPLAQEVSPFPLHLDIETTTHCNLKCPMCPRTLAEERGDGPPNALMTMADYTRIIDQAAEGGASSIKLNYLGEPLVHYQVVEQVRYAKQRGIEDVMFNSNGVLLTRKTGRALLEAGLDKLFISFDSPDRDTYHRVRIGADYDEVLDNVRAFCVLKQQIAPHVQLRVSMVMLDENTGSRQAFVDLFTGSADAIGFDEYRDSTDRMVKPRVPGFLCSQLYQRMFLRLDGRVTVCCVDDRGEYVVGDWREAPLADLWRGPRYTAIRSLHERGCYDAVPMCAVCTAPQGQRQAMARDDLLGGPRR